MNSLHIKNATHESTLDYSVSMEHQSDQLGAERWNSRTLSHWSTRTSSLFVFGSYLPALSPQLPGVTEECIWTSWETGREDEQGLVATCDWYSTGKNGFHQSHCSLWLVQVSYIYATNSHMIPKINMPGKFVTVRALGGNEYLIIQISPWKVNVNCLKGELRWHLFGIHKQAGEGETRWWHQLLRAERRGKLSSGREVYNNVMKDLELMLPSFPCLQPWLAHCAWTDVYFWKPIPKL